MGISGLLPLLKEITVPRHVSEFKGKTLAVDAYVWLHRGAYGCAEELAMGKPTIKYVNYAMHRVRMLKYYGVEPYVVFDGGLLPSKMGTEGDRERRRTDALARGNAFLAEGKTSQARECFVKAVDVTPAMAYQLIKALRQEGVRYVVAPYEADPQLAYLEKRGLVDGIITEDSDLLVFGCRLVLFKLDGEGRCVSIRRDDFAQCREYDFSGWTDREFRQMAILSGCDYLESIVGLGLKTAYRLMRKYKTAEKVVQFVRLEGQLTVPRNYVYEFRRAELTFLHQRVFDPVERCLVHLSPIPTGKTAAEMPFIGAELDRDYACGLADGDIDPLSKEPMVDLVPNSFPVASTSTAFKPTPATRPRVAGPSRTKSKSLPSAPPKGSPSILDFFARSTPSQPTSATSSGPAVAASSAFAREARVQVVVAAKSTSTEDKENGGVSPKRSSKFFGKGSTTAKGKGKEIEPAIEEQVEEEVEEEEQLQQAMNSEDEDAEMALRDVEMVVSESPIVDDQSVGSDRGSSSDQADRSSPPTPPPPDCVRESSVPPCISSPPAVTPRRTRRLGSGPSVREGTPDSDDAAISSPVCSDCADAGWDGLISSPPVVAPPQPLRRTQSAPNRAKPGIEDEKKVVKEEKVVKAERVLAVEGSPVKAGRLAAACIELSSDPIDVASSDGAVEPVTTPRPPTRVARPPTLSDAPAASSNRKAPTKRHQPIQFRPDGDGPAAVEKVGRKKRSSPVQGDDDEEEVNPGVQSVAASWRAKFMLQNSSMSKVGRPLLLAPDCHR
ncbi:hypothetical protein JCM10212_000117 [Sporobolomyces blumeae]